MLQKVLASERDELVIRRLIDDFVADDAYRHMRPVLLRVMAKIGHRCMRTRYENFVDIAERVAEFTKELVLCAHFAVVLSCVVAFRADFLLLNVLCVELQHSSRLMVCPDNGVRNAHITQILSLCSR